MSELSIRVEPIPGFSALLMTWKQHPNPRDVSRVFAEMNVHLSAATKPLDVIVDLTENSKIPLQSTILEVLRGPARHPMMGVWIVAAPNSMARIIGNVLLSLTRRENIVWHATLEAAYADLYQMQPQEPSPSPMT